MSAVKCDSCTNGNHTGTNGTPGCSTGECDCCKDELSDAERTEDLGTDTDELNPPSKGKRVAVIVGRDLTKTILF